MEELDELGCALLKSVEDDDREAGTAATLGILVFFGRQLTRIADALEVANIPTSRP